MKINYKPFWFSGLGVVTILVVLAREAMGYGDPPSCTPSCGPWVCASVGSVNNPGGLTTTNESTYVYGSAGIPSLTNTTFNDGQESQTCTRSDCVTYTTYASVIYTATNWWVPAIPATFTTNGTFIFTNEVQGFPEGSVCTNFTAVTNAGTLTVIVTNGPPVDPDNYDGLATFTNGMSLYVFEPKPTSDVP